jgi:hypothetical protein
LTDVVRFWTAPGSAPSTATFIGDHAAPWLPHTGSGEIINPGQPVAYTLTDHAPRTDPQLSITVAPVATGMVGVRADALVVPPGARCIRAAVREGHTVVVPEVIGRTQAQAIATLQALGLSVLIESRTGSSVRYGRVLAQAPAPGAWMVEGSEVTLTVSSAMCSSILPPGSTCPSG